MIVIDIPFILFHLFTDKLQLKLVSQLVVGQPAAAQRAHWLWAPKSKREAISHGFWGYTIIHHVRLAWNEYFSTTPLANTMMIIEPTEVTLEYSERQCTAYVCRRHEKNAHSLLNVLTSFLVLSKPNPDASTTSLKDPGSGHGKPMESIPPQQLQQTRRRSLWTSTWRRASPSGDPRVQDSQQMLHHDPETLTASWYCHFRSHMSYLEELLNGMAFQKLS